MQKTLDFLKNLKANNNRDWFAVNKPTYENARLEFIELVQKILAGISSFDPGIANVQAKDCIYRIYRDIRFSPNKTPYKTNFGAILGEKGRKTENAFYYIQLEPEGKSFLGAGLYMPESEKLKKIRQEIDYNADTLKKVIYDKEFVKLFGDLRGEKLKKAPKGYSPDDPNIELLKHKSYIAVHDIDDKKVTGSKFPHYCVDIFKKTKPFNDFLNVALSD